MGVFRQFPYSNFHDMNMDWLLQKMKELSAEWLSYHENWEQWKNDTDQAMQDLRDFVIESFDTLNVDDAVRARLDEMLEDGELDNIIGGFLGHFTKDYYFSDNYVTIDNLMDLSVEDAYALFEEYVTKGILTKSIIGYASTANTQVDDAEEDTSKPIIMYSWVRRASRIYRFPLSVLNKKILLTNAVHGNEKLGIPTMLTMLKDFEVGENNYINWLFNNFNIDFVPVVNPYGFDQAIGTTMENVEDNIGRVNARGVNLNRNGNTAWYYISAGSGTNEYKGPKPYSEAESRALHELIYTHNSDYTFYMDIHTERYGLSQNVFGSLGCSSSYMRSIFGNVIASLYQRFRETYGYDILDNLAPTTGITGGNTTIPEFSIDFYEANGRTFTSAIYEGPRYNDGVIYPEKAQKWTADIIVNFLYSALHWQPEYYASRNVTYNIDKLRSMIDGNLAPIDPPAWDFGYHVDGGWGRNAVNRLTMKEALVIDPTATYEISVFTNLSNVTFEVSTAVYDANDNVSWHTWSSQPFQIGGNLGVKDQLFVNIRRSDNANLEPTDINYDYVVVVKKVS